MIEFMFLCVFNKNIATMSLNKVILIGNVGRDPDVRYFDSGAAVANFPLATSERGYTLANGTVVPERTEWHNVVVRRDLVPFVEKWVRKGSGVYVEGKIRTRNYDDQSGIKRYVTEIHADRIEFYSTGSRPADTASNQSGGGTTQAGASSSGNNPAAGNQAYPAQGASSSAAYPGGNQAGQPNAFSQTSDADDLPF